MTVHLAKGPNELNFRLGDDKGTTVTIMITFAEAPATEGAPAPGATDAAVVPTDTPGATPFVPTPAPTISFTTFTDGTYVVGTEVKPHTYRLREPAGYCYWERLKGFSGELSDIIANENVVNAYAVVTIKSTDKGFNSDGCGEWTTDLSRVTASKTHFDDDGTYIVGTDLAPGTWRATGGDYCYWARLRGFGGTLSDIIANDNVLNHSVIVTIRSTDKGFLANGCGAWSRT